MASQEIAAMLDELMGRHRNANPSDKVQEVTWEDEQNCKFFLVDFCPHELFTNTKADLGPCSAIHDEEMKKQYQEAKDSSKKGSLEDEFLRFCQKMLNDVGLKIKRSKERLVATQMEQAAAAGITPEMRAEQDEKISVLTDKINVLVEQAEKAGCEGDVDEAQNLLQVCEELKIERETLKSKLGLTVPINPTDQYGPQKAMEVCETCGAFLVIGDPNSKIDIATANKIKKWQDDHLMGKMHMGYARLKTGVEALIEKRKADRELREKEREEYRKKREEERKSGVKEEKKSRSKSRDRERKRSRDRRRSRSKSRGHRRSRSRDRRHRPFQRADNQGTLATQRSRSRSRGRRDRSRSRDRSRRDRSRDRRR